MKIHTPKFIFNTAVDFFNVGIERCEKIFVGNYLEDSSLYIKVPAPATILAFSMELMLKSIHLYKKQTYPRVHELLSLYNQLSEIDQNEIEKLYSKIDVDHKKFPTFRYITEGKENEHTVDAMHNSVREEILSELKIHDISFVKWRYVFSFPEKEEEQLQYNFSFIVRLFQASFNYSNVFHKI
jgi:hypothetical protein